MYAAGNAFLVIAAFAYYLQYASGNLRYHLIGNAGLVVLLIPSVILAATYFGGIGAGYVWLTMNALFLLIWVAYVHHKLQPGLHFNWLFGDAVRIMLPASLVGVSSLLFQVDLIGRFENFAFVVIVGMLVISVALLSSNVARAKLIFKFRNNN